MFEEIGFIGLGLIGGSIAKATKKYNLANNIIAYDKNEKALSEALNDNTIDIIATDIDASFSNCQLIFLCCPVDINISTYEKLCAIVKNDCIITDVSSTKETITKKIKSLSTSIPFIGGHPMAGSEKSGYEASNAYLFENAYYVITPYKDEIQLNINKLKDFILAIKAIPIVIPPEKHDYITAAISHVPHILASLLVNTIEDLDSEEKYMHTLAAGGFKDITRIASSSPIMWQQVCSSNIDNIIELLDILKNNIDHIKDIVQANDHIALNNFFDNAKSYRDSFSERLPGGNLNYYAVTVDVIDEPGIIAKIALTLSDYQISIKNIGIINNREHTNGVLEIVFYDKKSQEESIKVLKNMNYIVYPY